MAVPAGTTFLAVLPADFDLPGLAVVLPLALATAAVAVGLYRRRPAVEEETALAFAPWMVAGGALRVVHELAAFPEPLMPLFGTPTVYLSVFVLAGSVWLVLEWRAPDRTARGVAAAGSLLALAAGALVLAGPRQGALALVWPGVAVLAAVALTALVVAVDRWGPGDPGFASAPIGLLVVFAHALDGTSTAVGVDVFGAAERTPLPRAILEVASQLPTAGLIGTGWLFVLVKIGVALVLVRFLRGLLEADPPRGYLLSTVVAAVGLGPGSHNVLLFLATGG